MLEEIQRKAVDTATRRYTPILKALLGVVKATLVIYTPELLLET